MTKQQNSFSILDLLFIGYLFINVARTHQGTFFFKCVNRSIIKTFLFFRIVSNLFQANTDFGEAALIQREFFTGRPFDKQFACKFTVPRSPELSTIGKIYIERILDNSDTEPLFDFILTKVSMSYCFICLYARFIRSLI